MKTNILSFLLGVFIMVSIAATVPNVVTVFKPQKPVVVVVQTFDYQNISDVKNFIINYSNKGYITKSISISNINGFVTGIVVMEKYY